MENIYMLADAEITHKIAERLKSLRLKQNISQLDLAQSAGLSLSSVIRAEEGSIKSFDTLLRLLRTLGKLDVFNPLVEEEPISPNDYFKMVNAAKDTKRMRASKSNRTKKEEKSEW
jgi:transcriptional regulator with XRE-family HTH domain